MRTVAAGDEARRELLDELLSRVHAWFDRNAPRVRDTNDVAELRIVLDQPQGDDDGTLFLEARVYATDAPISVDGRVRGVPFDPEEGITAPEPAPIVDDHFREVDEDIEVE